MPPNRLAKLLKYVISFVEQIKNNKKRRKIQPLLNGASEANASDKQTYVRIISV